MILTRCLGKLQKVVDQILEKKKDNPEADVSDLEKKKQEFVCAMATGSIW